MSTVPEAVPLDLGDWQQEDLHFSSLGPVWTGARDHCLHWTSAGTPSLLDHLLGTSGVVPTLGCSPAPNSVGRPVSSSSSLQDTPPSLDLSENHQDANLKRKISD